MVRSNDWSETFSKQGLRAEAPMHSKLSGDGARNLIEFGFNEQGVTAPGSFLVSQGVEDMIRALVGPARTTRDFRELPIPFKAVSTDVATGAMVVFEEGDLAVAMRASMAIPGAFEPVRDGERVLIDGGIVRNLPIDVARAACADIVIAVRMSTPDSARPTLASSLSVLGRTIDVVLLNNELQQWSTLGPEDVGIAVDIGDIGTLQVTHIGEAIPIGEAAARAHGPALARLALSDDEYRTWREGVETRRPRGNEVHLADVRFAGLDRVSEAYVASRVRARPGADIPRGAISRDTDRIYALGEFEQVGYTLTGPPNAAELEFQAVEKSWGPDYLEFDLGVYSGSGGDFLYAVQADHRRTWINRYGAIWHNTVELGRESRLETRFYQPLELQQRVFVEPSIYTGQQVEDLFFDGDRVATYWDRKTFGQLDVGVSPTTYLEARIGVRYGETRMVRDTGDPVLPDFSYDDNGLSGRVVYDRLDNAVVPTSGWYARIEYLGGSEALGADLEYDRLEVLLMAPLTFGANVVTTKLGYGTSLGTQLPANDAFAIGGFRTLPGLRPSERRVGEYWLGNASYARKVLGAGSLFGNALYGGVSLTVGRLRDSVFMDHDDDTLASIGLFQNGRTPFGAVLLGAGVVSTGEWQLSLAFGKRLDVGNLFGRDF
jgi:NTE family protein